MHNNASFVIFDVVLCIGKHMSSRAVFYRAFSQVAMLRALEACRFIIAVLLLTQNVDKTPGKKPYKISKSEPHTDQV